MTPSIAALRQRQGGADTGAARVTALLLSILLGSGCASQQIPEYGVHDPAEPINRVSFNVTEQVDRAITRPAARAYQQVLPNFVVVGIHNFFENIRTLDSAINGLLQGKPRSAAIDTGRFLTNTVVGLAGFIDVATDLGLEYQNQDFGQTLAVWGYTRSSYLYVPLLGPSTVRDLPGAVIKAAWVPALLVNSSADWWIEALDILSVRADRLRATDSRDATALESYSFTREAYYQQRRYLIFDGDPPVDSGFEALDWLDDLDDWDSAGEEPIPGEESGCHGSTQGS